MKATGAILQKRTTMSLQARYLLLFLGLSLVPLTILSSQNILQTQDALTNAAEASLSSNAQQTAAAVDTFIRSNLNDVQIESQIRVFVDYLQTPADQRKDSALETSARDLLLRLVQKDPYNITSYAILDPQGKVLVDTIRARIGTSEKDLPYFTTVFQTEFLPEMATYSSEAGSFIHFANVIHDKDGKILGIIRAEYKIEVLQQILQVSVRASSIQARTSIILLDEYNIRLADTSHPEWIQKSLIPLSFDQFVEAVQRGRLYGNRLLEEQATDKNDLFSKVNASDITPFFASDINTDLPGLDSVAVAEITSQPWKIVYSQPTAILLENVQSQTLLNISIFGVVAVIVFAVALFTSRRISEPILEMTRVANEIAEGNRDIRLFVRGGDEIGILGQSLNQMAEELQTVFAQLEARIAERTASLQKRSLELETAADVAREISIIRDTATLLNVSVNLIRDRFNFYHVGIFLFDERREYAILRAASGSTAHALLEAGVRLKINEMGDLGNSIQSGRSYFAENAQENKFLRKNALLPETVEELFLPLRSQSITIGMLDIQINKIGAVAEDETKTLQLLSDQIAAAIENTRLAQQVQNSLETVRELVRAQIRQTWQTHYSEGDSLSYEYDGSYIKPIPANLPTAKIETLERGTPVTVVEDGHSSLLVPLLIQGEVIGVIGVERDDPNHIWSAEEMEIAQAAANRAALTLENARLLEDSQKRAAKEKTISEASARIGTAFNIENILHITAEELERILGDAEIAIQFQNESGRE